MRPVSVRLTPTLSRAVVLVTACLLLGVYVSSPGPRTPHTRPAASSPGLFQDAARQMEARVPVGGSRWRIASVKAGDLVGHAEMAHQMWARVKGMHTLATVDPARTANLGVVTLNLFDDTVFRVRIHTARRIDDSRSRLYGTILGEPWDDRLHVTLYIRDGGLAADVPLPDGRKFVVTPLHHSENSHLIRELSRSSERGTRGRDSETTHSMAVPEAPSATPRPMGIVQGDYSANHTLDANGNVYIDALGVYFNSAQWETDPVFGGHEAIKTLIENAAMNANDAAEASGAKVRFRVQVVPYQDNYYNFNSFTDFHSTMDDICKFATQQNLPNVWDWYPPMREEKGTDTLHIYSGQSHQKYKPSDEYARLWWEAWIFNTETCGASHIVDEQETYWFAHTQARLMGCRWDKYAIDSVVGNLGNLNRTYLDLPYAAGHSWRHDDGTLWGSAGAKVRTEPISPGHLNYKHSYPMTIIKGFSTPLRTHTRGSSVRATGDTGNGDCVAVMEQTRLMAAAWQPTRVCEAVPGLDETACGSVGHCRYDHAVAKSCVDADYGIGAGCSKVTKGRCDQYTACRYCVATGSCQQKTDSCSTVSCSPGQYFNTVNSACESCPPGHYGSEVNLHQCHSCPEGTYLPSSGRTKVSECIDCQRWQYSPRNSTSPGDCTEITCDTGKIPDRFKCVAQAPARPRNVLMKVNTTDDTMTISFDEPDYSAFHTYTHLRSLRCRVRMFAPGESRGGNGTVTYEEPQAASYSVTTLAMNTTGVYRFSIQCYNGHNEANGQLGMVWGTEVRKDYSFASDGSGTVQECGVGLVRCDNTTCSAASSTSPCGDKSCQAGEVLCNDGSCGVAGNCPSYNGCPINKVQCSDYSCADISTGCPSCVLASGGTGVVCSDGACAASCSTKPKWKRKVAPVFTSIDSGQGKTLEATESGGTSVLGRVTVGAGAIADGAVLSIDEAPDSYIHDSTTHTTSDVYSALMDLTALDSSGNSVFDGTTGTEVTVQLSASLPDGVDLGSACLGYYDSTSKAWACEDKSLEAVDGEADMYKGTTSHFTTFGVIKNAETGSSGRGISSGLIAALVGGGVFVISLHSCLCCACLILIVGCCVGHRSSRKRSRTTVDRVVDGVEMAARRARGLTEDIKTKAGERRRSSTKNYSPVKPRRYGDATDDDMTQESDG